MSDPYKVVRDFEAALCEYTGAKYAVTTNSCTMALLLACAWHLKDRYERRVRPAHAGDYRGDLTRFVDTAHVWEYVMPRVEIPRFTYVSVPMAIIHAGGRPVFDNRAWLGAYQLKPLPVWDSARRFTANMFNYITASEVELRQKAGGHVPKMLCVSFHASKILGDTQGGAILHDNDEADEWLRRARFDGRAEGVDPKDDHFDMVGWHCYLSADVAARLLLNLYSLPKHNDDLPNSDYPDLSTFEVFK